MKTIITQVYKLALVSAALFITSGAMAREDDRSEKSKSYTKSYSVSSSDKISIENKFGETRLEVWNNNEIKVDVQITVKASSDTKAQQLLDNITISDGKDGSGVYFKTSIDQDNNKGRNNNTEMKINYTVHLPANNPLTLNTQFGNTFMPDYAGLVDIETKFGEITAGNLRNVKEFSVQFGKGDVKSINNGKISIGYSSFNLGSLSGDIDAKFEFCDGGKVAIDNNIKSLTVYNNYSTIKLSTSKDISADFDIETHFGEFSNRTDYAIKEQGEKDNEWRSPRFDYHYTGKAGGGNIKIKIKSNFGTTTIM